MALNANKVNDMLDALNEAMEIHAQNAIKNLPFNKTELVEIVDITKRDEGWYVVWNGSTRYMAFSENTSYKMGAKVYVTIPNNNFDNQKTIVGQQVVEGEQSIFFRSPLVGYQPMTDNILAMNGDSIPNEWGLVANAVDHTGQSLEAGQEIIQVFSSDKLVENSQYSGHKYIAISANVKTLLEKTTIGGNYGIKVVLEGIKKQDTIADVIMETRTYYLDTKNMIGSVYNFDTYYKQEALFDISDFDELSAILVVVYQDGTFKDNENNQLPHTYKISEEAEPQIRNPNILIKDIEITFGEDVESGRDTLKVKTLNGTIYNSSQKNSLNEKNLYIEWTHLNPETEEKEKLTNRSEATKMEDIGNYVIHWYRDSLQSTSDYTYKIAQLNAELEADRRMTAYEEWRDIEEDNTLSEDEKQPARNKVIATFNLNAGTDYIVDASGKYSITERGQSKINGAVSGSKSYTTQTTSDLAGAFWREMTSGMAAWDYTKFLPDLTRQYTKVKVIIEYWSDSSVQTTDPNNEGYVKIVSNELQFNNLAQIPTEDKNSRLKIEFTDKTGGDYPIYNSTTGQLLNRLEETKDREFKAVFNDTNGNSYFNGNEILIWKIPISNSMILMNESFYGSNEIMASNDSIFIEYGNTINYEDGYIYIKREVTNFAGGGVNSLQSYRIAPYYNKGRTTNTIWCYVIKNNEIYYTSATLTFNQHGTCGTDYTFTLGLGPKIIDETPAQVVGQDPPAQVWTVVGPSDTALTIGDTYIKRTIVKEEGQDPIEIIKEFSAYHEILFDLYNSKNEKIDLTLEQKNAIIDAWIGKTDRGYYSGQAKAENLEFIRGSDENEGRVVVRAKNNANIDDLEYIVLQAFVSSNVSDNNLGIIEFYQYLPLHIRAAETNWELNGSDYIVYDDKGANPTCYNDKFELIKKVKDENGFVTVEKFSGTFEIKCNDQTISNTWYPHISNEGKLQPPPLYVESITKEIALIAQDENEDIIYTCPIVIVTNKYEIPAINKWNGELQIDNQGNKILASMVGAGRKNTNGNTFDGVLMGEVQYKDDYSNSGDLKVATGLFGYNNSERAFGFDINGEAFIGKPDVGRIYINGNTGRITSSAREAYNINKAKNITDNDPRGTEINLKDNYIDIQGIGNSSRIHIDAASPYFFIDSTSGTKLINIANNDYYLQSNDKKVKINLGTGEFSSTGKLTITGDSYSNIKFGKTFEVKGDGKVILGNLKFVDSNGAVLTGRNTADTEDLTADNIVPQWKTFVTDVSGTITAGTVEVDVDDVTCYVEVVDTTVTNTIYRTYDIYEGEIKYHFYARDSMNAGNGSSVVDEVTGPFDYLGTGEDLYKHSLTISYSEKLDTYTEGAPIVNSVPTVRTATGKGTGKTTVPVVKNIKLTVEKISMWALTNDDQEESTVTIKE